MTYPVLERAETRTRNDVGMSPNFIKMLLFRSLSQPNPNCLGDGRGLIDFQSGCLRDIGS